MTMSDPMQLLNVYAAETAYEFDGEFGPSMGDRDDCAPKAFAANRAVLDLSDSVNVPGATVFYIRTDAVLAIVDALGGE